MATKFYIYIYCDTRKTFKFDDGLVKLDYKPFYVGKGKGFRYRHHMNKSSLNVVCPKSNTIKAILKTGLEPEIVRVYFSSESEAYDMEEKYIDVFGRRTAGGILTNMCTGGEIGKNYSGYTHTEKSKSNMGKAQKIRLSDKSNHPFHGKKHNTETRNKISESAKGRGNVNHIKNTMTSEEWELWQDNNVRGENHPMYGKKASKKQMEVFKMNKSGNKNPFYGKVHTDKSKEKMRRSLILSNVNRLVSSGLIFNETNFNKIKSRNCPKFKEDNGPCY